ncbi:hypothetical protein ACO0LD_18875 [Undibacterium sp. Ji83W]|uniref:hypothetical protein n=1 Tax=Undibacterium sp. Ji83W TaxID=3413043 RepID=UPI003BEF8E40
MFYSTVGKYTVSITTDPEEIAHKLARSNVVVHKHIESDRNRDDQAYIAIGVTDCGHAADLLFEGWYFPGPLSGFHPGVLIIPETATVFIGIGEDAYTYSMAPIDLIAKESAEAGFWYWSRYGNTVLMCAELELSAWSLDGKRKWTRFVEPPWHYSIESDVISLDIMGDAVLLSLETGENVKIDE